MCESNATYAQSQFASFTYWKHILKKKRRKRLFYKIIEWQLVWYESSNRTAVHRLAVCHSYYRKFREMGCQYNRQSIGTPHHSFLLHQFRLCNRCTILLLDFCTTCSCCTPLLATWQIVTCQVTTWQIVTWQAMTIPAMSPVLTGRLPNFGHFIQLYDLQKNLLKM